MAEGEAPVDGVFVAWPVLCYTGGQEQVFEEYCAMTAVATAIYEKGTLRLLTPVSLPERARVLVQIQEEDQIEDDLQRAVVLLEASGLLKPATHPNPRQTVSPARRAALAQLYAAAGPLSEWIIAERHA